MSVAISPPHAIRSFHGRRTGGTRAVLAFAALVGSFQLAQAAGPVITCASNPDIFNTAYDGASGVKPNNSTDTYWQVTTMQPRTPNVAVPMSAAAEATLHPASVGNLVAGTWANSPYPTANWISNENTTPPSNGTSGNGDWYYVYDFVLDPAVNPAAFSLQMNFLADNSVAEIYVNGTAQAATGVPQAGNLNGYVYAGYQAANAAATTLASNWQTGQNRLVVRVQSDRDYEGFLGYVRPAPACGTAPRVSVTKTAPQTAVAGSAISYTVTATNTGSVAADGTLVTDTLPASLTNATWTCTPSGGAACPNPSGNGSLAETIATFPAGGSVVYTINATIPANAAAGALANTASLTPPAGGVCDGPNGSCAATASTNVSAAAAVPTLGQWALIALSALMAFVMVVRQRRAAR